MNLVKTSVAALSLALLGAPAMAQQNGLVNVRVGDVLSDNTVVVQVPIGIAAQVCGINAAVLVRDFKGTDAVACTITQEQAADSNIRR
jgi:hypothetical protein